MFIAWQAGWKKQIWHLQFGMVCITIPVKSMTALGNHLWACVFMRLLA